MEGFAPELALVTKGEELLPGIPPSAQQCPAVPSAQCPVPSAQCPVPSAQNTLSMLNALHL